ncbi:MAG: hypothetical protein WD063_14055 [Pirellulales bacterium]
MSESFNGYHVWLGIPPNEQPPNYYRLLGITAFETDLDVIDHAADRQMAHVRTFQSGRNAGLSQQILNELAGARVCLLNPRRKADYDVLLRTKLAAQVTPVPVGKALPVAQPAAAAIPRAAPVAKPSDDDEFGIEPSASAPLASPVIDDDELLSSDMPRSAPAIETHAPRSLVNRDASLQRALVYVFTAVVIIILIMLLFGMLRRIVGTPDWKQWFTVPSGSYSSPSEPGADGKSPAPPPKAPTPAPPHPGAAPNS